MTILQIEKLTRLYPGSVIGVNDINLSLTPGAYGLLGPNGAGKSTLLNLITGQLRPSQGSIRVLGMQPWNNAELFKRIGLCPADEVMLPNVSGFDWVRYLLEMQGFSSREAKQMARDELQGFGLADAMHRPVGTYSKGMRQRTKLAQAICHRPEFLILDEPFNGLDPIGRHEMNERLRRWIEEGGSLLLASHILHEVEAVSDSFLLICGGRLLASGRARAIRRLLAQIPSEVRIVLDEPDRLCHAVIDSAQYDQIQKTGPREVIIKTRQALELYQQLPRWIDEHRLEVEEIDAPDESLELLFDSLLSIHRGES